MSSENEAQDEEQQPEESGGGGRKVLIIALTIGLVVGAAAGSLVVGPLVAEGPAKEESGAAGSADECAAVLAQHGVVTAPVAVHTIETLVLNPAQSGGTRYLMASVGFGLADLHGAEQMTLRDAEIRDIVVRVLGSKTVAELSDLSLRNGMKEEMRTEIVKVVGEHGLVDIYFPQFVIQ